MPISKKVLKKYTLNDVPLLFRAAPIKNLEKILNVAYSLASKVVLQNLEKTNSVHIEIAGATSLSFSDQN